MLSVKLLLLLATFSALEMMVFHVNIAPQLQHEKEGSKVAITLPLPSPLVPMQTEAPSTPEPSTPSTPPYVPPVHRLTTAPEKLYKNQQSSEGRKTEQQQQQQQPPPRSPPSPLTTEPPFSQLPSSQKETQHRSHYQSELEQRSRYKQEVEYSTSRHSQQEVEDDMARRERLRYENQGSHIGEYYDALASGLEKTAEAARTWGTELSKYECPLKSDFPCHPMLGVMDEDLPAPFLNACAPNFLIPGTVKSGTTSLYFYLKEHPQVHQALSGQFNKEVRFFTENYWQGASWYLQQFPPIKRDDFPDNKIHMIHGEASPTYFYEQTAPALIKATIPNVKLIVVLRDPIERAYSDKMQLLANGVAYREDPYIDMKYQIDAFNMCFAEAKFQYTDTVDAFFSCYDYPKLQHYIINSHPYVMDSIYVYQVQNWLKHFSREQILFIKGEDMFNDAIGTMEKVTEFLGLCQFDWSPFVKTIHNRRPAVYPSMPIEVRGLLTDFYQNFTRELYEELDNDFKWTGEVVNTFSSLSPLPAPSPL